MKKKTKFLVQVLIFLTILLSGSQVMAFNINDYLGEIKYSEDYLKYLELNDEEKEKVIVPRMYEIPKVTTKITNPLKMAIKAGSTAYSNYSLKSIIPENKKEIPILKISFCASLSV